MARSFGMAWWWDAAAEAIERATGVKSRAVALPSCGEAGGVPGAAGLYEDAAALGRALDQVDDAIIVAHSYGGTVVAQGAVHPAVRHLVYISSYLPEVGDSQASATAAQSDPVPVRDNNDGTVSVVSDDHAYFDARFWDDVSDPGVRAAAYERLTPQSIAAFGTPTTAAAWRNIDSTYLICADDRSTDIELQRFHAARATDIVVLPTSHHPFLSRPDMVAKWIEDVLESLGHESR